MHQYEWIESLICGENLAEILLQPKFLIWWFNDYFIESGHDFMGVLLMGGEL